MKCTIIRNLFIITFYVFYVKVYRFQGPVAVAEKRNATSCAL